MLLTYPGYADYVENFTLDSVNRNHNFGNINLLLKSKLLADVIIKGTKAAIKIKGDTTEFNASSYTVQPNARVEDLLKQLPGIQVDKDGKITAQGQTVSKVLVDGEEFFGDDPTLVTKNIRSDMVDKIQLYDKKSDQAAFTGVDDGQKTKTINVKLKADKKNGYFGKLEAGIGTDGYYQGQALYNLFKGKKKFSAYGTVANTSKTGLSWEDNQKYGGSNNTEFVDGGFYFTGSSDDFENGYYNGEGLPKTRTGGLHYDTKWRDDKYALNTNYKLGVIDVDGAKNIQTQNNLPTGTINTNSDQQFHNNNFRQKLDATLQVKIDTTANLKLTIDGTNKNIDTRSNYEAQSVRGNDVRLNNQTRSLTNAGYQDIFNTTAFYTKKLKKKGRTFSASLNESYNASNTHGYLNSEIDYFNTNGLADSTQNINQFKTNDIKSNIFSSNFTYTEPLGKAFNITLNYGIGLNNSTADRRSYNATGGGQYLNLDPTLSNDYKLTQIINLGGAIFNYTKKKTVINFGSKISEANFDQVDQFTNNTLHRSFTNWMPQASYLYKFSQRSSVRVSYNGNTTQPSIEQIQPLLINTDPLNVTLGNPDLKPSFRNSFNLSYNSYKVLSDQYVYIGGNYTFTGNAIVNNTVTDSAGKSTYQYINLAGKRPATFYLYTNYGRKLFAGINGGGSFNINGNTSYNYINSVLSASSSYTYSFSGQFSKNVQKKFNFYLNGGPTYTVSKTSIQSQINNNGRGFTAFGFAEAFLPGKVRLSSELSYEYRAPTQSFNTDYKKTLVNATVTKSFFKDEGIKFSATVNDLFNQNTGFSRAALGNQITQTTYTTIKRYFMFSLIYDFSKVGGPSKK